MGAARLLCEIIEQGAPVLPAQYRTNPSFTALLDHGYLEETGTVQSVHCEDCSQSHDAEVVFVSGQYGIYCPDLGFIPRDRSELAAIRPNLLRLVEELAQVLGCTRTKSTPIEGQTWRIGMVSDPSADVALYFQPTLRNAEELRLLERALSRETRPQFGIVFAASGELPFSPFKTHCFADCFSFDLETGHFELEVDLRTIADAPKKQRGGRPSPYKTLLPKIIRRRRNSGDVLTGINQEAKAILLLLQASNPNEPTPSLSTIKRYIQTT